MRAKWYDMRMKRPQLATLAAVFAIAVSFACADDGGRVFLIRTCRPHRQAMSQGIRRAGNIVAPAEVVVSTKVAGRLVSLETEDGRRLEEGVPVKAGSRIAKIEDRDHQARLDAAKAAVSAQEAGVKDARREFDRVDALFRKSITSQQERDVAEAVLEKAEASLAQAKAELAIAEINLDETTIRAPMDGVVSKRSVEPGTLLSVGNEIAVVTQTDPLRFQMDVPTTRFSSIKAGETPISIMVDAYPGEAIETVVSRVYPVADASTRTLRVEAQFANHGGRYVPGMYAVGSLALGLRDDVLCVPFDAMVRNGTEWIVYRVDGDVARAVHVTPGVRDDAVVEVVAGLSDDDEIVLEGQHRLTDGARIRREASAVKGKAE